MHSLHDFAVEMPCTENRAEGKWGNGTVGRASIPRKATSTYFDSHDSHGHPWANKCMMNITKHACTVNRVPVGCVPLRSAQFRQKTRSRVAASEGWKSPDPHIPFVLRLPPSAIASLPSSPAPHPPTNLYILACRGKDPPRQPAPPCGTRIVGTASGKSCMAGYRVDRHS